MLTLDKAIDDQRDLHKLCNDRPLETNELFKPNSFYGIDSIIKEYCSIPHEKLLKVVFPHGVSYSRYFVWEAEKNTTIPCIYYYSPHRYEIYKKKTNKIIIPAASPFIYLTELLKYQPKPVRKGTIFFPSHSTHHVTATFNFDKIIADIEQLEDKYKPVTICIYWKDFNLGHHKLFEERGFRVVSAGHMFDPWFLYRLYYLCSAHKYSASNELGSHLFYSVKAGCSFFFIRYHAPAREAPTSILERDVSTPDQDITKKLLELFSNPIEESTPEQLAVVDEFLGSKYLKTPSELRAELEFADKLDKFGFSRHPETKKMYYRMPNLIPRELLRNMKRNLRNNVAKTFHLTK